ncbi:hypothetical protein AKJ16_DCAP11404 [Drosera capensis]
MRAQRSAARMTMKSESTRSVESVVDGGGDVVVGEVMVKERGGWCVAVLGD